METPLLEAHAPSTVPAVVETPTVETPSIEVSETSRGSRFRNLLESEYDTNSYMKGIIIGGVIALIIYGFTYYKKANDELEKEKPTFDDIDALDADINELKYNLKKALGNKYETLKK